MDITDRKRAEQERAALLASERAARERAEAASRTKDQFLAMVSHELRSPLSAILGWSQLLRSGKVAANEASRALETIERNARTQVRLIEDLLDTSRIISGKLVLDRQPVDMRVIIEAALDSIQAAARSKSIDLKTDVGALEDGVLGDPARLQQVVWNLLSNAVKFTPPGGRVNLRANRADSYLNIVVSDSGAGISPFFLPHVFERFSQASTSTARKYGGLGLGLSIVRSLVELHGGTVKAESPGEGLGATFTVTLPFDANYPEGDRLIPSTVERAHMITPSALEGLRILLIEDEFDVRGMLTAMLTGAGAEVMACSSASEALKELRQWRPSVLVSDIGMPDEDGYSLIRKVRAMGPENGGDIPAVALTGYARSEDRTRVITAGFQVHVPKPVEADELIAVIASLVGRGVTFPVPRTESSTGV